jgi:shikimate kinase
MPSAGSEAPVFLVGMMGAGKTTLGMRLARALGRRFVDLDQLVEEQTGESIARLIERGREQAFRELERGALRRLDARGAVVATGGGSVVLPGNLEHMLAHGRVAYLRARPETLAMRLRGLTRPLLAGHDDDEARRLRLTSLLRERGAAYERAHMVLDVDEHSVEELTVSLRGWVESSRDA